MQGAAAVDSWLRAAGARLGLDFALDDGGSCGIAFGDALTVVVDVPRGASEVVFYAAVGRVPSADADAVLRRLLSLNLHAGATDGATLGVDEDTDEIVLARRWPISLLDASRFEAVLGHFAGTARRLAGDLARDPSGPRGPEGSSDLLINMQWRV